MKAHPSIAMTILLSIRVSACLVWILIMGYLFSTGRKSTFEVWPEVPCDPWVGGLRLPQYPLVLQFLLMTPTTFALGLPSPPEEPPRPWEEEGGSGSK